MKWLALFSLAASVLICQEDEAIRRIYAHLLIHDPASAVAEAKRAALFFPDSKSVHLAYLRALSEQGNEAETLKKWSEATLQFQDLKTNRVALESLAWGVLQKGEKSEQLTIRFCSLLGAALTQDVRAVPLIDAEMSSSNAMMRSLAVKLAGKYGDAPLQMKLARLLKEEKVWHVRLEVIRTIGSLRMIELRDDLKEIVADSRTLAEEKAASILALVDMYDSIGTHELKTLLSSKRAGLRQFGCELIAALNLQDHIADLKKLTSDSCPDVRQQAIYGIGLLNGSLSLQELEPLLKDLSPSVAITAAWTALVLGFPEGGDFLRIWLDDPHADLRRFAAAALSSSGQAGVKIATEVIEKHPDPYVRANLAIGLIGQRQHISLACQHLYATFESEKEAPWMWDRGLPFQALSPSGLTHHGQIPNYPRVVDQLTRLDVLTILSIVRYPQAQEAVKKLLKEKSWGVIGAAAATLMEEGDEESLALVRGLLNEADPKVSVQAALILALLGGDPSGMEVLKAAYPKADREMKVYILEALGRIGDAETIPFLVDVFKEPFQLMRVVAASALIQSLYH